MILILRPLDPALLSVIDAVLEGPDEDPEVLRREFGIAHKDEPDTLRDVSAFVEFLEERGYRELGEFREVDTLITEESVKHWAAPIIPPPV